MIPFRRLLAAGAALGVSGAASAATEAPTPPARHWGFSGAFGSYDLPAARRGFQVYEEGCAACHAMTYLHYRDLAGIGFTPDAIKAIAAKAVVPAGIDASGKPVTAPATPASAFPSPFPSEEAARAALNGAYPPDLSLAANATARGPDYIYALLTGYRDPPPDLKLADGMSYNLYFPGHQIAMPPPLSDGQFTFADGTKATAAQEAADVTEFLAWAANPEATERKRLGLPVIAYCLAMAGLCYALQRRLWSRVT